MIQQPRIPPTGQRQAIEVHIKWREVLDYKRDLLRMLSVGTGWDVAKLDADMQRPLYMRPQDALEYGLIDEIIQPDAAKSAKAAAYWVKSGRAETDGRLEQWKEYIDLQEKYSMKDQFKKVRAQALRDSYRETAKKVLSSSPKVKTELDALRQRLPDQALTDNGDSLRLPFSRDGLKMALLNAERYADRNVRRQLKAERVKMPDSWKAEIDKAPHAPPEPKVDYAALVSAVEAMDPSKFAELDLDQLVHQYTLA
eukprot:jgi/Chrzof1/3283/Cz12g19140.t1